MRPTWPAEKPREKGIDVALAIDFVTIAVRGQWSGDGMHNRRLAISGQRLWCHWLDETSYRAAADETDYS